MSNRKRIRLALTQAARDLDARFFDANPGARGYTRLATQAELKASNYPRGTLVYVQLLSGNKRLRAFVPAAEPRRN